MRLEVYTQLYVKKKSPYVATHKGKEVSFEKLEAARDFAKQNGYSGIHISLDRPAAFVEGDSNG